MDGLRHMFAAFGYSMAGLNVLMREKAAQLELIYMAAAAGILMACRAGFADFMIVGFLFLLTLSLEAANTAIELIVDRISPEQSGFAKKAKDLGSLAVFFPLLAIALYLTAVVARTFGFVAW